MKNVYIIAIIFISAAISNAYAQSPGWEWAKGSGAVTLGGPQSICTDASGNAYILGSFSEQQITFGSYTLTNSSLTGANNIFMVKYDTSGNVLWAKSAGGTDNALGQCITIDAAGDIFVTGLFSSQTFILGDDTFTNGLPGSASVFFLAKFDGNGNFYWGTSTGLAQLFTTSQNINADAAGNVYVTGNFGGAYQAWGTDTLYNPHGYIGNAAVFIAKYNLSGNITWLKALPGTSPNGSDYGHSTVADQFGNVYVTGYYVADTIRFPHDTLTGLGFLLAKYTANGTPVWAKSATGAGFISESSQGIGTDAEGNIYVTGQFSGPSITFGTTTLTNAHSGIGSTEVYLVKYDTSGNVLWAKGAGGTGYNISNRVSVDALGNAYITGNFGSASIAFGNDTLTSTNNGYPGGIFVVKYDAAGNVLWAKNATGNSVGYSSGLSAGTSGDVYITGYYTGPDITFGASTLNDNEPGATDFYVAKMGYHPVAAGISNQPEATGTISVYPNPAKDYVTVETNATGGTLKITDITGREVAGLQVTGYRLQVNTSRFASGVYFVTLNNKAGRIATKKLVIE